MKGSCSVKFTALPEYQYSSSYSTKYFFTNPVASMIFHQISHVLMSVKQHFVSHIWLVCFYLEWTAAVSVSPTAAVSVSPTATKCFDITDHRVDMLHSSFDSEKRVYHLFMITKNNFIAVSQSCIKFEKVLKSERCPLKKNLYLNKYYFVLI